MSCFARAAIATALSPHTHTHTHTLCLVGMHLGLLAWRFSSAHTCAALVLCIMSRAQEADYKQHEESKHKQHGKQYTERFPATVG